MLTKFVNGCEIRAQKPACNRGYIVMAFRQGGSLPFVTWFVCEDGHAYHGHYFADEAEALSDFNARR